MSNRPLPGLIAGINAGRIAKGLEPVVFPAETTLGSMAQYITTADFKHFQPMNANFGFFRRSRNACAARKRRMKRSPTRALEQLSAASRKRS